MKFIINDFNDDLNYQKIVLYVGNVDLTLLYKRLEKNYINHLSRFENVIKNKCMYVENCDLQDINNTSEILGLLEDGYVIAPLQFDGDDYYIEVDL